MELLTTKQRERRVRDQKVAEVFQMMREMYPKASYSRIIIEMATRNTEGLTSSAGIRDALVRTKAISVKKHNHDNISTEN